MRQVERAASKITQIMEESCAVFILLAADRRPIFRYMLHPEQSVKRYDQHFRAHDRRTVDRRHMTSQHL